MEATFEAMYSERPGDACRYLTTEYQAEFVAALVKDTSSLPVEAKNCEQAMSAVLPLVKGFAPDRPKVGKVTIDGDHATASNDGGDDSTLVKTEDGWLIDGEKASSSESPQTESKDEAKEWPAEFCSLKVGDPVSHVIAVMGEPTARFDGSDGATPQVQYSAYGYDFTVFLDVDEKVTQLYAIESGLNDAQRDAMTCEPVRTESG